MKTNHFINCIVSAFGSLHAEASQANRGNWFSSKYGADLWIDGTRAILNSNVHQLKNLAEQMWQNQHQIKHSLDLVQQNVASLLKCWDVLRPSDGDHGINTDFQNWLALGIVLLRCAGGLPDLGDRQLAIVNDSVACLLSRSYRRIRLAGYQKGIQFKVLPGVHLDLDFRPEFALFAACQPSLITSMLPQRIQFFCISHEVQHVLLFGDAYYRKFFDASTTAGLLLNAEETVVAFDMTMLAELRSYRQELHLVKELLSIQTGKSPFFRLDSGAPLDKNLIVASEALTKWQANRLWGEKAYLVEEQHDSTIPQWIGIDSICPHVEWVKTITAERDSIYYQFAELLPAETVHQRNILKATSESWLHLDAGEECQELSDTTRMRNILANSLKRRVLICGELVYYLLRSGFASADVMEDFLKAAFMESQDLCKVSDSWSRIQATPSLAIDNVVALHFPDNYKQVLRYLSNEVGNLQYNERAAWRAELCYFQ